MNKISSSSFTIVANGFADGPAQALRDYLIKHKAKRVVTITHPLVPESEGRHAIITYENGQMIEREIKLPNKPPITYMFDPLYPVRVPASDVWFGFNNLACARGLLRRSVRRDSKVVYWAVDFVPNRFGSSVATKVYDAVDRFVSHKVDLRVELSEAALKGRAEHLKLDEGRMAAGRVVPMGAWLERTPKVADDAWKKKKIVYLGHLVERQGVASLIDSLSILMDHDTEITAEIIGSGPLLDTLKQKAKKLGIGKRITFHGFVESHQEVEDILASGTVAVAPYQVDKDSFTQFADPGKLKAYLGAYLPIVLTDVPPNAKDLAASGAAIIVKDTPESIADGIEQLLSSKPKYQNAVAAAKKEAAHFDWEIILRDALNALGYS
jgi:glycosyltransferase involved in cell wall biosynthesis